MYYVHVLIDTAVTSEINTNNRTYVLLKVAIAWGSSPKHPHILLQDLLHFHLHIHHLHSHGWLASRHVAKSWTLVQCWSTVSAQCLSPPAQRWISPSCRLTVAGNQTLLHGCSFQAKFQVGCIFISVSWQVYPSLVPRPSATTPRRKIREGKMEGGSGK